MNVLPSERVPANTYNLLDGDGVIFFLIIATIALVFVGYLVFDWIRGRRAARRLEELRQRARSNI